jgi:hypothetical protein
MTELEIRKLERMGKAQKARYLKAREEKREQLIEQEEARQERRIQDAHCRLFRILLAQVRRLSLAQPSSSPNLASQGGESASPSHILGRGLLWLTKGAKAI